MNMPWLSKYCSLAYSLKLFASHSLARSVREMLTTIETILIKNVNNERRFITKNSEQKSLNPNPLPGCNDSEHGEHMENDQTLKKGLCPISLNKNKDKMNGFKYNYTNMGQEFINAVNIFGVDGIFWKLRLFI